MKDVNLSAFRSDVERLVTYIPWLESKVGTKVSKTYDGKEVASSTFSFPVYETMLLNFVNEAAKTELMDRNYVYAYSSNAIRTVEDEFKAIDEATVQHAEVLVGILSKYVLGGMTKGTLWTEAVQNGVFLKVLKKMKELLEIWDAPLA